MLPPQFKKYKINHFFKVKSCKEKGGNKTQYIRLGKIGKNFWGEHFESEYKEGVVLCKRLSITNLIA